MMLSINGCGIAAFTRNLLTALVLTCVPGSSQQPGAPPPQGNGAKQEAPGLPMEFQSHGLDYEALTR
ncbi:MAG: hypothetical protein JO182_03220, partial [Acidobacteriaceae bacterium]|nr:hypothetical protein [Acidobacteriaceae bacterium]